MRTKRSARTAADVDFMATLRTDTVVAGRLAPRGL